MDAGTGLEQLNSTFRVNVLSEAEFALIDQIAEVSKAFGALDEHHPNEIEEWVHTIHILQRQVMARAARRAYPEYFTPMVRHEFMKLGQ